MFTWEQMSSLQARPGKIGFDCDPPLLRSLLELFFHWVFFGLSLSGESSVYVIAYTSMMGGRAVSEAFRNLYH